jgi:hypothetical protein
MSCCPIQASCALLIGPEYILSEVVVRFLSIPQRAPVLEQEPLICPTDLALRLDRAEVWAEV